MGAPTTTVRVSVTTPDRLRGLSARRWVSTVAILDDLAAQAEEQDEVRAWAEDLRDLPAGQRQAYEAELADRYAVAGHGVASPSSGTTSSG
jgi:hypothetical protein